MCSKGMCKWIYCTTDLPDQYIIHRRCFPIELKLARVVPIFKTGYQTELINYRPISVLSFFQKFLRKLCIITYLISSSKIKLSININMVSDRNIQHNRQLSPWLIELPIPWTKGGAFSRNGTYVAKHEMVVK